MHLAPLAVLEQDGRVHLLHSVIEALQRRFHHDGHHDVGVQFVCGDGDGTETECHQPTLEPLATPSPATNRSTLARSLRHA